MSDRADDVPFRIMINIGMAPASIAFSRLRTQSFIVAAEANLALHIDVYTASVMKNVVSEIEGTVEFIAELVMGPPDWDAPFHFKNNDILPPW